MWVGPRPCSARQPRLRGPIELGDRGPDEDLGRDGRVSPALPGRHRGRRRCPQRNPNLANDPAKLIPVLGGLPPGTPVAFEAAYGWAGWSSCWRNWSWSRTWSIPAAARPSPRPGARTTRSMRPPWPSCCGRICCPRPGSPPAGPDLRALLCHRAALVRLSTSLKNRVHAVLADRGIAEDRGLWTGPGRAWPASLVLPPTPRGIIQDGGGLVDALATPSPGGNARSPLWPSPTHGSRRCWPVPSTSCPS
jgi:hypothetical protein